MAANEKAGPARELHFDDLNDAIDEAKRLLAAGYERSGNWTLAQAAGHCAQWLDYSMSGEYPIPLAIRPVLRLTGRLFGPRLLRQALQRSSMPPGVRTLAASVPAPIEGAEPRDEAQAAADAAAVADLQETVRKFTAWTGPIPPSPIFGRIDKQSALQLHCIHLAHHLGYLIPHGGE